MKHFETLYEESEKLFANINRDDLDTICKKIKFELDVLNTTSDTSKQYECLGKVIFYISGLSNKLNMNVYSALNDTIEDYKIAAYDLGLKE